ncbi:MAG: hypothetical protein WBH47_18575 [Streptosporangiaceae bacterium]
MGDPVQPAESGEVDAQLAHLFDYCRALLGSEDNAVRTARSVMVSAHALLQEPDLRAWLFALARSYAVASLQLGGDEPRYEAPPAAAAAGQQPRQGVMSAFAALPSRDREILDLVYRHGIRPADLGVVLAIPAEEAYRRLAKAEREFIGLAAGPGASAGADLEHIADLPLAALPAPKSSGRLRRHRPARDIEGAPRWRALARRRMQLVATAVVLVAAIVWGVVYLAAPGHPGGSHGATALPGNAASSVGQPASTPNPAPAPRVKPSAPPAIPIALLLPVPGRSANRGVTLPPPSAGSSPPTSSPPQSPSPSPVSSPSPSAAPTPSPDPSDSSSLTNSPSASPAT